MILSVAFLALTSAESGGLKKCYPNMPDKAIHHNIHKHKGNFGTWIPHGLSDKTGTVAQCQEACEANDECKGYSFRDFRAPFKCYLHNGEDITYSSEAANNGGFTSSVCESHQFNKEIERDGKKYMRNCFSDSGLMRGKALHHGIHAKQGSFGSLISHSLTDHGTTTEQCAEECENDLSCAAWSFRRFKFPFRCYLHPAGDVTADVTAPNNGGFDSARCTETLIVSEPVSVEMVVQETVESFTESKQDTLKEQVAEEVGVDADDVTISFANSRRLLEESTGLKIVVTIAVQYEENNEASLEESVGQVAEKIVEKLESTEFTESTGASFVGFEETEQSEAFAAILKKVVAQVTALKTVEGADRTYSPTAAKACCKSDCNSQSQSVRKVCKKGCERWIAHSSLNWQALNRAALKKQCKKHCHMEAVHNDALIHSPSKDAKYQGLYSEKLTSNEESGCHIGCDTFDACSYEESEN